MAKDYDYLLKVLLVGDSDVGKHEIMANLEDGSSESPFCSGGGNCMTTTPSIVFMVYLLMWTVLISQRTKPPRFCWTANASSFRFGTRPARDASARSSGRIREVRRVSFWCTTLPTSGVSMGWAGGWKRSKRYVNCADAFYIFCLQPLIVFAHALKLIK